MKTTGEHIQHVSTAQSKNSQKVAHAAHTSYSSNALAQPQASSQTPGLPAFLTGAGPIVTPGTGRGHNLAPLRPATWRTHNPVGHSSLMPDNGHATDSRSRLPGMHMTADSEGDDFQSVLTRLAPANELPKLREAYRDLQQLMNVAVETGDFAAAIRYRDQSRDLRSKDPAPLTKEAREAMWRAAETHDFKAAAKYRDQVNTLHNLLPENKLSGAWQVHAWWLRNREGLQDIAGQGKVRVQLVYNGDKVSAIYDRDSIALKGFSSSADQGNAWGNLLFEADVSEPKESTSPFVFDGHSYVEYFEGTGYIDALGGPIPGKLYLMADGGIGFSFIDDQPSAEQAEGSLFGVFSRS